MADSWDILKLLSDSTRVRILSVLACEELSVAELQEVLNMGQSRISSHLSLLRQGGLVVDRRDGKKTFYTLSVASESTNYNLMQTACKSVAQTRQITQDFTNLKRILEKRKRKAEEYFNSVAGRLGKNYCPGRNGRRSVFYFLT